MKHPLRSTIIVGNWKMYKTVEEAVQFFQLFQQLVSDCKVQIYLAVPFTAIRTLADMAKGTNIVIGAQNMNDAAEGAFTGEIAGRMLVEAGARFVLLGHSERRRFFNEDDFQIYLKVRRALDEGLQPIVCVGETQGERNQGLTATVLGEQIKKSLSGVPLEYASRLIVAYEPVWAIGTFHAAPPDVTCAAHLICRKALQGLFGEEAERIPILYGGSVKPENADLFIAEDNVDGLLVGAASLDAESFAKIARLSEYRLFNPMESSS
jgi:triosephosphate isomerase (TIM)